jgi:hypothetical protein
MRLLSPLIVLLGIAATGQALAAPPEDVPAAVTVLRGSSAPPEPVAPPPAPVDRSTIIEYRYLPAPPAYPAYYVPLLPVVVVHRHR